MGIRVHYAMLPPPSEDEKLNIKGFEIEVLIGSCDINITDMLNSPSFHPWSLINTTTFKVVVVSVNQYLKIKKYTR